MLRRFANQAVLLEGDGEDLGRLKHLIEACGVPVHQAWGLEEEEQLPEGGRGQEQQQEQSAAPEPAAAGDGQEQRSQEAAAAGSSHGGGAAGGVGLLLPPQQQQHEDEEDWLLEGAPDTLVCPISLTLLHEGVVAADGFTCTCLAWSWGA